jgi:cyclomaltodextrinase / maltogenic alpha-amylase / neopullulanase
MRRWLPLLCVLLAALPALAQNCKPDPLPGTTLYLRGSMSSWAPLDEYAFQYRCDAYVLNVDLKGRQEFKIADASWTPATNFGAGEGEALVRGGGNAARPFDGEHTLRLVLTDGQARLSIGPRTFADPKRPVVTDPVALGLRFDSRATAHKSPFGAAPAGTTVRVAVTAPRGVEQLTLVIETRLLQGNQDKLQYTEVARLPMTPRAMKGGQRWQATHRFTATGVYGYWFEARIAGVRHVLHNNNDNVHWTRERGSGGAAVVALAEHTRTIRRFRQTVYDPAFTVPDWAGDAVYYQIFPDRFRNGDPSNDPQPGRDRHHAGTIERHTNWLDKPWRPGSGDGSDTAYNNDFFGGDLAGITDKLDELKSLGVNTLYLTPIFRAASNHKYDTADYRQVDPAFGRDEDFARLTRDAARRGMRVIPDASFNHTGSDSVYFDRFGNFPAVGAFEGGKPNPASPFASWFRFDTTQADPDKQYTYWASPDLPEIDKASPAFRAYAFGDADAISKLWLDRGAAGWRMDVAPWVPDDFWRDWRRAVKAHRPDALTIAETWFDASKYFLGDMFDSTMNYVFRNAVLEYAAGGKASGLVEQLEALREAYPPQALHALMNLLSTHDQARALHHFGWHDGVKDTTVIARAKQRLLLAVFIQMTYPGAPTIYYGDEVGVTGGDDPYNRATYPWQDVGGKPDLTLLAQFKQLTKLRNDHAILRRGKLLAPLHVDEHVVVFAREHEGRWALAAVNNADAAKTVTLALPAAAPAQWRDALAGGAPASAHDGRIALTVPALGGAVWLGR